MVGANKKRGAASIARSHAKKGNSGVNAAAGYGGHFRAVQGFRYYGAQGLAAAR